jgi:hypothetical protein
MNPKRWWMAILMAGLIVALSAPSALAWTNRHFGGHQPNYRGHVPQGRAYGWHGQRPAWNNGRANGYQHHNQWNHRNFQGAPHRGAWGPQQRPGQFHNPDLGRSYGPHNPYTNTAHRPGPVR